MSDGIKLSRKCEVVEVPGGRAVQLPEGTLVSITQALGGSYTLMVPSLGGLFRLAGRDGDAIGKEVVAEGPDSAVSGDAPSGADLRDQVWAQLKTCFDPEIPVNIVDLGLIYELEVGPPTAGGSRVDVKMTLTAQGCGMGDSIAADARHKIEALPGVEVADVQIVWEPAWTAEKMTAEGKTRLGIN
jgi:probable FeS assembly SUF system protein SufT